MNALIRIFKGLALLATFASIAVKVRAASSPEPFVRWLRAQPDPGPPVPPPDMADYERRVDVRRDLVYPSRHRANTLDLYVPKGARKPLPTIVWVHGGGFVAGDKSGTAHWCTLMASHGYAVVSMNYEVAPEARYPAPSRQAAEVCEYLRLLAAEEPALDPNRLVIGGDSAGAHIASQFLAAQTNPELARLVDIPQTVPENALKAALLYCGPYEIKRLAEAKGIVGRFFTKQLGWAYLGERNWAEGERAGLASTVDHVTSGFPPAFITDGNSGSFEAHGRALEEKLRGMGVTVESLFFPPADGVVLHEYQFKLDSPDARRCMDRTLAFLSRCLEA